jgi:tetratricopeptide (TPR) repeat protein
MRFLKLGENGEINLMPPVNKNIPVYAILSHTWGPDSEEVTFNDLKNGMGKGKIGYQKLKFCGEQAARDGLTYFWIDTCCIDKLSSAELSEAINSMFKWYREATRCYIYLSDVPDPKDSTSTIESCFPKSRWFTRGWTLQELVAPSSVQFFSWKGEPLGDRKSQELQIHQITGIAIEALQGKPLSQFSVDERLLWSARRETTVEEDSAYCLLGIFDVYMPLIYGEGQKNALDRLKRKIQKTSNLASLVSTEVPWIVPFERNPRFTGRDILLVQLEEMTFAKEHTSKIAITGLGGVGKTQLVLELLYRVKDKHKDCSVMWIPATNTDSLHQGYLVIARWLEIPGWDNEKADVKKLVQEYLSKDDAGQWILVFDNADDIDMWMATTRLEHKESEQSAQGCLGKSRRLIDYLPKNTRGCIIFTTRDKKAAVKFTQQNIVKVPEMNWQAATELLKKCLANADLIEKEQNTAALLAELTYLPLAIVQAAAYINENGITPSDYLTLLKEKEEEMIDLLSEEFEDDGRYHNIKNPVATTWLISFEQIRRRDPLAVDYLSFMACVDPRDIPQTLLPPGRSRKKEMEAIGVLIAYSFVSKRPTDLALDLHRLVQLATRNWLRKEGLLEQWMKRTLARLEEVFPDDDHKNRSIWRVYIPHVRYVLEFDMMNKDGESRMSLMQRYGRCLYSDGRWNEAEAIFSHVLTMEMRSLGAQHPFTLSSMANLASTYRNQGRWEEAEQLDVQVMELSKKKLGDNHPDTLTSMANLASTYRNQGRWEEAEQLEVQVMELSKKKLGDDHPSTINSMANLALTYRNQGRWEEAEQLQVQVMELRKKKLGDDHPSMLTSMANLASTYRNQGRWEEAEQLEVQVMELSKKKLGGDHPDTLNSMANLASTYWSQGWWEEAEQLEVQVMELSKKKLGDDHPDTLNSMANLTSTYRNQGRWEEAEKLQVQVMELSKKKLGDDHPDTLSSMANLAATYWNQGRWEEAEQLEVQVMELSKKKLGDDHPDTLNSMANLASTYRNQGRWEEAEQLEVRVIELSKKKLGDDHPDTLSSMANLASTYWNQRRWEEAEQLDVQVMELRKKKLGDDHPSTLTSMANLASTYRNQGRWKEAEKLQAQELDMCSSKLGKKHPDTLISMENLALIWKGTGRKAEALQLLQKCVRLRKEMLGSNHPYTVSSSTRLARWEMENLDISS